MICWPAEARARVLSRARPAAEYRGSSSDASCAGGECCAAAVPDEDAAQRRTCVSRGDVLDGELSGVCLAVLTELERRPRTEDVYVYTDSQAAIHWLRRGCAKRFVSGKQRLRPRTRAIVGHFETLVRKAYPRQVHVRWKRRSRNAFADAASRTCVASSSRCANEGGAPACRFVCTGNDLSIRCFDGRDVVW